VADQTVGAEALRPGDLVQLHREARGRHGALGAQGVLARRLGEAFVETDVAPEAVRRFLIGEGARP